MNETSAATLPTQTLSLSPTPIRNHAVEHAVKLFSADSPNEKKQFSGEADVASTGRTDEQPAHLMSIPSGKDFRFSEGVQSDLAHLEHLHVCGMRSNCSADISPIDSNSERSFVADTAAVPPTMPVDNEALLDFVGESLDPKIFEGCFSTFPGTLSATADDSSIHGASQRDMSPPAPGSKSLQVLSSAAKRLANSQDDSEDFVEDDKGEIERRRRQASGCGSSELLLACPYFEMDRPRYLPMEVASSEVPTQNQGLSPSTASSTCEDMEGESNTTPDSSASEGEISFTGELYSDSEFDEDLDGSEERHFVAIEVDQLLQNFRKKQQQEAVYLRSCTGSDVTSTSSRSSGLLSIPEAQAGSSHHAPKSKRPWRMTDGGDEDSDDRGKRLKQVTTLEDRSEPVLRLFACPYSKYDSSRYSLHNLHEKHYRHCSSIFSTSISRLKQHLYRVHKRPEHHCERCFAEFSCHQHLANHIRSQLSCDNIDSPFDEKMTHDQASLIKRRSRRQSPSEAWFFIYKTLFPMSPLPSSPFAVYTTSPNAQSFRDFFNSQTEGILQSFRSQVERDMPSIAARERNALDSILESCLGRMNSEEYASSNEASPNAAEDGYRPVPLALSPPIIASETVPIDEVNRRLPEQFAASVPLPSEVPDTYLEMNNSFEPLPASSRNIDLEDTTFGDIFTDWGSHGVFDSGEASAQTRQVIIDQGSPVLFIGSSCVDPRDCTYDDFTQG